VQDGALLDAWITWQASEPPDLLVIEATGLRPTTPIFALLPVAFCYQLRP
jgi:hypothetical protein